MQWNLVTAYIVHLRSHSPENKVKFLADAVAFHKHRADEDSSEEDFSEEDSPEEDLSESAQLGFKRIGVIRKGIRNRNFRHCYSFLIAETGYLK